MIGPSPGLAANEARWHTATCTISRPDPDGEQIFDPNTGQVTDPPPIVVYEGPCKVTPTGGARVVEFGEGPIVLATYDVGLDGPVAGVKPGDDVAVVSERDPSLNAAPLTVLEVLKSDVITNRQLICEGPGDA